MLGLTALVHISCDKPWLLEFNPDVTWPMYVSPAFILLLYASLASETRRWCEKVCLVIHVDVFWHYPPSSFNSTVDHNIFAARKFRELAPMYIFATQNFRECPSTSTKKKITITPGICRKKLPFLIMRSAMEALSLKPLGVSR